jgi:hypothetical protein
MKWATLFSGWNLMRSIRLMLGIFILMEGINSQQWIPGIVGGIFLLQALLNVGCCGTNSCNITDSKVDSNKTETIQYEEIKIK